MPFGIGVITGSRTHVARLMDHPHIDQGIQNPVNSRSGQTGHLGRDRLKNLVRRGMVLPDRQGTPG